MEKIMEIPWDKEGVLRSRPNRFLAIVDIDLDGNHMRGQKVHVRDPGRLKELLYPGNRVLVKHRPEPKRKTKWEMIAAWDDPWILINSGYHRAISEAILNDPEISPFGRLDVIQPEVTIGHSRIDFMLEKDGIHIGLEVKGCTLEAGDVALFPDAPTERGAKHVQTLIDMKKEGKGSAMMILVFRSKARCFRPNDSTDRKFTELFWQAFEIGVEVHPVRLSYEGGAIYFHGEMPVCQRSIANLTVKPR